MWWSSGMAWFCDTRYLLSSCKWETLFLYVYRASTNKQTKMCTSCNVIIIWALTMSVEPGISRQWVEVFWTTGVFRFCFVCFSFLIQLWGHFYYFVGQKEHATVDSSWHLMGKGWHLGLLQETWSLKLRPSLRPRTCVAMFLVRVGRLAGDPALLWWDTSLLSDSLFPRRCSGPLYPAN